MKPAFLLSFLLCACAISVQAQTPAPKAPEKPKGPTIPADAQWHDVTKWGVEGRGWGDQERKRWFDRLPAKAEGKVTNAVWNLSRDSSGMMVRFKTDAKAIYTRYEVMKPTLGMPAMPATGVSGLDLYARDEKGQWRWVACPKPTQQKVEAVLIHDIAPGEREFAAYLPLYKASKSSRSASPPVRNSQASPRVKSPSSSTAPPSPMAPMPPAPAWFTLPSLAVTLTALS